MQTIHQPRIPPHRYFAVEQEACRKDIECVFRVLQQQFVIVARPTRYWRKKVPHEIMTACIILHNMIIKSGRDLSAPSEVTTKTSLP